MMDENMSALMEQIAKTALTGIKKMLIEYQDKPNAEYEKFVNSFQPIVKHGMLGHGRYDGVKYLLTGKTPKDTDGGPLSVTMYRVDNEVEKTKVAHSELECHKECMLAHLFENAFTLHNNMKAALAAESNKPNPNSPWAK